MEQINTTSNRCSLSASLIRWVLCGVLTGSVGTSCAQLVISEVCSKNDRVLMDPFGHYPDWIELFNSSTEGIDLGQYHLSDRANHLNKWQLPSEELAPGAYLVLFSEGSSTGPHYFNFRLSQAGEGLFLSQAGDVVQSMEIPWMRADHSVGMGIDIGSGPYFYAEPTPGAANTTATYSGYAASPFSNVPPGLHPVSTVVQLNSTGPATVRYTVDGRDPDESAPVFSAGIVLDSSMVIKAVAYRPGWLRSEYFVGTYLVNEQTDLPIVSLSTHPDSLFSWEHGIYVLGPNADPEYPHYGANYWEERYVPTHFEFFDERQRLVFTQRVDLSIHGGRASRNMPQRPLRLTARKAYGPEEMEYRFFPERPHIERFKRLVLRNSGADFCLSEMRDGLFHQVSLHNNLDIDELAFRPALVFINGRYWGLMNIRERIDEDHLHHNYGADRDDLLLMEEENISIQGDAIHFHELKEFIIGNDMNDPVHFAYVAEQFDLESFKDYFALEIHAGNADWPSNNLKYWKPSITEGKWRYLLYDLDATMGAAGWIPLDFDMFYWILEHRAGYIHAEIYRSLMRNDEFRRTFLNRLADLLNTALASDPFAEEAADIRERIKPEIERHFDRWGCNLWYWHNQAEEIIPQFALERPDHVRNDVLQWYELPNTAEIRIKVFPAGAGRIHLNSLQPDLPFTGTYFNGNAIDLAAIAEPGFTFDHWEYSDEPEIKTTVPTIQRSFARSGEITAYFRDGSASLHAFPNPFTESTTISVIGTQMGTANVSVFDAQGRLVHRLDRSVGAGVNAIELSLPSLSAGIYQVVAQVGGGTSHTAILKLDR